MKYKAVVCGKKLNSTESPDHREESERPEISGFGSGRAENGRHLFWRGTGVYGVSADKRKGISDNVYRGNKSIQITVVNYQ